MREERLLSVGIDIGTSTTQCVFSAITLSNTASAFSVPRIQITEKRVLYRAPLRLTPLTSPETIDAQAVERIVSEDYAAAGIRPDQIRLGAVIITGEPRASRTRGLWRRPSPAWRGILWWRPPAGAGEHSCGTRVWRGGSFRAPAANG